jgi:hypothetical protein
MVGQDGEERPGRRVLFGLAIAAAAAAAALAFSGGFSLRLHGIRVSSHGGVRPALFAVLFAAIAYRLHPRRQNLVVVGQRAGRVVSRLLPWVAAATAIVVLGLCFVYGVRAAGASDTYGYVSQARLWLAGDLHVHQDFAASVPWPNADWTFTPLGYRPAPGHTIVPTYAPGLPLLMAMFMTIGGTCGAFVVTPLSGAMLVLLTFALGVQVSGRATGALAALLTASSPTILFMTLWPMSDVPAAAFWMLSLVMAARSPSLVFVRTIGIRGTGSAALSGIAAGVAILIRPNLVPLVVFPAVVVAWRAAADGGLRIRRLVAFVLACLPFGVLVGWVNHDLYGSFLMSGYGDAASIYNSRNVPPNLHRYPSWLLETQGLYVFLFLLAVALPRGPKPESRTLRWILLAYIAAVFGCYLFYVPFDDWWYLRFVIPAMPAMFVLSVDAIWQAGRRFGPLAQAIAAFGFTALCLNHAIGYARQHTIFEIGEGEQKYADVGRYLARELPPQTVVIAGLHSGNIRLYSQLRTLRVDSLEGAWLDRAIDYLKSEGPSPYIVLEGSEVQNFRRRFANQKAVALVDRAAVAVHSRDVYLFSTDPLRSADQPETIPHTAGCK